MFCFQVFKKGDWVYDRMHCEFDNKTNSLSKESEHRAMLEQPHQTNAQTTTHPCAKMTTKTPTRISDFFFESIPRKLPPQRKEHLQRICSHCHQIRAQA